jgi:hypothetical protein
MPPRNVPNNSFEPGNGYRARTYAGHDQAVEEGNADAGLIPRVRVVDPVRGRGQGPRGADDGVAGLERRDEDPEEREDDAERERQQSKVDYHSLHFDASGLRRVRTRIVTLTSMISAKFATAIVVA